MLTRSRGCFWLSLLALVACDGEQVSPPLTPDSGPDVAPDSGPGQVFVGMDVNCYWDGDADGYGAGPPVSTARYPQERCPFSTTPRDGDCIDIYATVYPGAPERCDDLDNDCDEEVDEGAPEAQTWFPDADGDGYGANGGAVVSCEGPTGYVQNAADCEDLDPTRHPGAEELDCADPIDYNCDGSTGYTDADLDGWVACQECDDRRASVHPGAAETCNEIDDDCDGYVDPDSSLDAAIWYEDADADGWGGDRAHRACLQPSSYSGSPGDCDEQDPAVNPGATEICDDGLDNDCDGTSGGCGAWGSVSLSTGADLVLVAEMAGDHAGYGLSGAGDFTGDGGQDVLVGATNSARTGPHGGAVFVITNAAGSAPSLQRPFAVYEAENSGDNAGGSLSALGDTNGDGVDDVLIGAWLSDAGGADSGAAYLLLGPTQSGVISLSLSDARLIGEAPGDLAGISVAGPGDVNGDGLADLLVGARWYSPAGNRREGAAYLLFSPISGDFNLAEANLRMVGAASGDAAGQAVGAVGDLDGDGHPDLGVGAPAHTAASGSGAGVAYFVCDPGGGTLSLADATAAWMGAHARDGAGSAIASAGDLDGDGYGDVLVGAYAESSYYLANGAAYVLLGPVSGENSLSDAYANFTGVFAYEGAGRDLDGGGDLNGDGELDIVVGAPYGANGLPGRAYVTYGPIASGHYSLGDADAVISGERNDDYAGVSVAFVRDISGDGVDELLIGATENTAMGVDAGAAYVIFGGAM